MAGEYPFGIDDGKVTGFEDGTLGSTKVDILGITALSTTIESESVEHRGDNETKRTRRSGKKVTGSAEQAAHQPALLAVVGDGEVTTSGDTPATVTTYTEPSSSTGKEYQIEAQAADGVSAARITVLRATTTNGPTIDWAIDQFSNPGWDYEGKAHEGSLFTLQQYETEEPIE